MRPANFSCMEVCWGATQLVEMEHIDSLDRFVTPYSKPRGLTVVQSKFKALQAKLISTVASCASWMYFFTLPYSAGRNAYHIHTNSKTGKSLTN